MTIRPTVPEDTQGIVRLTDETKVFKPIELEALVEVLNDYHEFNSEHGHRCVTCEDKSGIVGYAYYAPAAMTDRTWYLYWIAIQKQTQARGIGAKLLGHVEGEIKAANGRVLFIETSSLPHYDLTRKFYLKQGYSQEGVLHDYYSEGDHMVVFRKHL